MCDAGITCNRLLNFLLSQEIDFMCAISQRRVDRESREKLRDLKSLYAYRVGEGSDKERVVVSNKGLSKRQFKVCYKQRWQVEEFIQLRGGDRPAYYVFT